MADKVVDLGFVSDEERNDAFAAASAYIQPSRMESFSRTTMEAWLAGTPVITLAASDVVAWHCRRSGGGLTYANRSELAGALQEVSARAEELGAAGRRYVIDNYTWPTVLDRMEASLRAAL
jgi:glycosyltransferase involved in cell wall biosynthesis